MKFRINLFIVLLVWHFSACQRQSIDRKQSNAVVNPKGMRVEKGNEIFVKSAEKVLELQSRAEKGDVEAIKSLGLHFEWGVNEPMTALKYWRMGADLGDKMCIDHYCVDQLLYVALPAAEEAEKWAESAVEKGDASEIPNLKRARHVIGEITGDPAFLDDSEISSLPGASEAKPQ